MWYTNSQIWVVTSLNHIYNDSNVFVILQPNRKLNEIHLVSNTWSKSFAILFVCCLFTSVPCLLLGSCGNVISPLSRGIRGSLSYLFLYYSSNSPSCNDVKSKEKDDEYLKCYHCLKTRINDAVVLQLWVFMFWCRVKMRILSNAYCVTLCHLYHLKTRILYIWLINIRGVMLDKKLNFGTIQLSQSSFFSLLRYRKGNNQEQCLFPGE